MAGAQPVGQFAGEMGLADARLAKQQDGRKAHRLVAGDGEGDVLLEVVDHVAEIGAGVVEIVDHVGAGRADQETAAAALLHLVVEGGQRFVAIAGCLFHGAVDGRHVVDGALFSDRESDFTVGHDDFLLTLLNRITDQAGYSLNQATPVPECFKCALVA